MKLVKCIIYSIMLGLVAYKSLFIIEPDTGTFGWAVAEKFFKLQFFILAFVISDLWLHNSKMRIVGMTVFISFSLFCVKDYIYSKNDAPQKDVELGLIVHESSFEEYWKLNGLLVCYQISGIGISCYLKRRRRGSSLRRMTDTLE